jgi:uncharacterized coiled-coil protein SlyX
MSENICDTCHKSFSTKYNLSAHKKTSKSCLALPDKISYGCEFCEKDFTTPGNLQKHLQTSCKDKKLKDKYDQLLKEKDLECGQKIKEKDLECEQKIKEKDLECASSLKENEKSIKIKELEFNQLLRAKEDEIKQILKDKETESSTISSLKAELKSTREYLDKQEKQVKELQDKLERISSKAIESAAAPPMTTNNNNKTINNNIVVNNFFTQDYIDKKVKDNFSRDHLIEGVKGVAKFTLEHIIKEGNKMLYVCTDSARQVFYFLASDGTKTKDFKSIKLINALQKPICEKSLKIIEDADQLIEDLSSQKNRNVKQERELNLSNYAMTLWTEGDLCTEVASLNKNGFSMELTKLTSV